MKFRVATWNLDHASNQSRPADRQLERIKAVAADIWVLTETCDRVDLSAQGYNCKTPFKRNEYGNYWTTVWLSSSFSFTQQVHSYDDETITCVEVDSAGGRFLLYATILPYAMYRVDKDGPKKWDEHYKEILAQGAEWHELQGVRGLPMIVAGDFNQARDGIGRYSSRKGRDLLTAQLANCGLQCVTEEDFGKLGKLSVGPKMESYRHNIDHICVTSSSFQVKATGAWDHFVGERMLSDHNGVYVDLTWRS